MDINVFFAVIFAAFLHATWNGMVKSHKDKYVAVAAIVLGHIPASLIVILFLPMPAIESIPYIVISAFVHQGLSMVFTYILSSMVIIQKFIQLHVGQVP